MRRQFLVAALNSSEESKTSRISLQVGHQSAPTITKTGLSLVASAAGDNSSKPGSRIFPRRVWASINAPEGATCALVPLPGTTLRLVSKGLQNDLPSSQTLTRI